MNRRMCRFTDRVSGISIAPKTSKRFYHWDYALDRKSREVAGGVDGVADVGEIVAFTMRGGGEEVEDGREEGIDGCR